MLARVEWVKGTMGTLWWAAKISLGIGNMLQEKYHENTDFCSVFLLSKVIEFDFFCLKTNF